MKYLKSRAIFAAAIILLILTAGYGSWTHKKQVAITRSLLAQQRSNRWRILTYNAGIYFLNLEDDSLDIINTFPVATPCKTGMGSLRADGGRIVFSETSCSDVDSLIVVNLVTRKREELLELPSIMGPRWSPNGDSIAFTSKNTDQLANGGTISLFKLSDRHLLVLADDVKAGESLFSWSPDGERIVYQTAYDEIKVINLVTHESEAIDFGQFPAWSPNGRYISYQKKGQEYTLYDVNTGQKSSLLKGSSVGRGLIWSPDSRYVVYSRLSGGFWGRVTGALSASDGYGDLCVMDVHSKVEVRLCRHSGSIYATDWGKMEIEPGAKAPGGP